MHLITERWLNCRETCVDNKKRDVIQKITQMFPPFCFFPYMAHFYLNSYFLRITDPTIRDYVRGFAFGTICVE